MLEITGERGPTAALSKLRHRRRPQLQHTAITDKSGDALSKMSISDCVGEPLCHDCLLDEMACELLRRVIIHDTCETCPEF